MECIDVTCNIIILTFAETNFCSFSFLPSSNLVLALYNTQSNDNNRIVMFGTHTLFALAVGAVLPLSVLALAVGAMLALAVGAVLALAGGA